MDRFFTKTFYNNGDIISEVILDMYEKYNYENILFIRTPTTGDFLDKLLVNNSNITRIIYETYKISNYTFHPSTYLIDYAQLPNILLAINKRFDFICIDTFHAFITSRGDLHLLSSFLSRNGIMICHDCFPLNKTIAQPLYNDGDWCGETYAAFIDFAYENPHFFYALLKIDTGIGMISKIPLEMLKNDFDRQKQEIFLSYKSNNNEQLYDYFVENCEDMMNIISK
jgi:hypothetical protein